MKKTLIFCSTLLLLALGLTFTSCDDDNDDPKDTISLTVDPASLAMNVGDTQTLTATVKINDIEDNTLVVAFSSQDEAIATVDASGLVTALAAGSTIIEATYNDETTNCNVIVTAKEKPEPTPGSYGVTRIVGTSSPSAFGTGDDSAVLGVASQYSAEELLANGTKVVGFSFYIPTAAHDITMFVYSDNAGEPGDIIASKTMTQVGAPYLYCALDDVLVPEAGKNYWFALQAQSSNYFLGAEKTTKDDSRERFFYQGTWEIMNTAFLGGNYRAMSTVYVEGGSYADEVQSNMSMACSNGTFTLTNNTMEISGYVTNNGVLDASNFNVTAMIGTQSFTENFDGITLKNGQSTAFTFTYNSEATAGDVDVNVTLNNNDGDETDGTYTSTFEVLAPQYARQSIYIDQFTSQSCTYCPGGEESLAAAFAASNAPDAYAWVAHHVGYVDDDFTLTESEAISTFWNVHSAPQMMLDRRLITGQEDIVLSPYSATAEMLNLEMMRPAEASINVDRTFDATTNTLTITVSGETKKTEVNLTVNLIQGNIEAAQISGGDDYRHSHVIRAYIAGNLGENVAVTGEAYTKTYTYVIPAKIGNFDTVLADMELCVAVGVQGATPSDCVIYNATRLPVLASSTPLKLKAPKSHAHRLDYRIVK